MNRTTQDRLGPAVPSASTDQRDNHNLQIQNLLALFTYFVVGPSRRCPLWNGDGRAEIQISGLPYYLTAAIMFLAGSSVMALEAKRRHENVPEIISFSK